jgi:uncharacterized oxidoreductase
MELAGHSVLVTGGASGIGSAIAARFLQAGSDVLICGRRADKLREAQAKHPKLRTHVCDVEDPEQRVALYEWAVRESPALDVLVNNAGVQRRIQLATLPEWAHIHHEIAINFEAHVHLAVLFIPHLREQKRPAIINVSSGLAFAPLADVPIYCATKAAMHSFTQSLRHQLRETPIKVVELIPPAVDTDLGGPGLHTWGVPLEEFADAAFAGLRSDDDREISYQFSAQTSRATREQLDEMFKRMNQGQG